MASLGTLSVDLVAKTGGFDKNLKGAQKRTETFGRRMRRFTRNMKREFAQVGKQAALMGTAVAGALGVITVTTIKAQDKIGKLASQIGISTEALSELQYAAEKTGSSGDQLSAGLGTLAKRLGEVALTGSGAATKGIEALGLNIEDLIEMSPDKQFETIADAMANLSSQSEKNAVASSLFSRANQKLVNTLAEGSDGLRLMREQAKRLGLSLSQDQTDAAATAADALDGLKFSVTGLANKLTSRLAPKITEASEALTKAFVDPTVLDGVDNLADGILAIAEGAAKVAGKVNDLGTALGYLFALKASPLAKEIKGLKNDISSLQGMINKSTDARGTIAGWLGTDRYNDEALAKYRKQLAEAKALLKQKEQAQKEGLRAFLPNGGRVRETAPIGVTTTKPRPGKTTSASTKVIPSGMTEAETASLAAMQKSQDKYRDWMDLQQQRKEGVAQLVQEFGTREQAGQEWYEAQVTRIHNLVGENQQADALIASAHAQMVERFGDQTDQMSVFATRARENIQDTLGDTLQQTLGGHFDGIGKMWLDTVEKMAANAAAANLNNALFGDQKSGSKGLFGLAIGAAGTALSGWLGGGNMAAATAQSTNAGGFTNFGHAAGGLIRGPGTGTSDSIPAWLSNGEGVLTADAVRRVGPGFVDALNAGKGYAQGGVIGGSMPRMSNSKMGRGVSVVNHVTYAEAPGKSPNERDSDRTEFMRQFQEATRQTVKGTLSDMASNGELDETLSPYNLNRNMAVT